MAVAAEFLGIAPMDDSSVPATDSAREASAQRAGKLVMELLSRQLRPRQIVTRAALGLLVTALESAGMVELGEDSLAIFEDPPT